MTNKDDEDPVIILVRICNTESIEEVMNALNTFYKRALRFKLPHDREKALEFAKIEWERNPPMYGKYNLDPEDLAEYFLRVH